MSPPVERRLPRNLALRLALALSTRGLEVAGKLALYVFVARQLSLADAGLYFSALAWASMGGALARAGLERAVMARIAAELAIGDGVAATRALRQAMLGTLIGGIVVGGATALAAPGIATGLLGQPSFGPVLLLAGPLLLAEALAVTCFGVLAGLHRNVAAQLTGTSIFPVLALALFWLSAFWLPGGATVEAALLATIAARFATTLMGFAFIFGSRRRFAVRREEPAKALSPLWRLTLPLFGIEIVQAALVTLPTLILAAVAPPEAVGAFSMAMRISVLTWVLLLSVSTIAAPRMAEQYRREEWQRLRVTQRAARWVAAALALPALAIMAVFAPWILGLLGPGFEQGAMALRILAAGQAVNALFATRDTLLANTGQGRYLLRSNLGQACIAALLAVTAVPAFGAEGAAAMVAITTAFGALAASWIARRRLPRAF